MQTYCLTEHGRPEELLSCCGKKGDETFLRCKHCGTVRGVASPAHNQVMQDASQSVQNAGVVYIVEYAYNVDKIEAIFIDREKAEQYAFAHDDLKITKREIDN